MTQEKQLTRNFPFPTSPEDGVVVFHQDMVCQYYESSNTWSCSRLLKPLSEDLSN
jgi:hypothetical protein